MSLLPAFYEYTGGKVTIDGQPVAETSLTSLRHHIAVVSQEPFLFNGTIRENIQYGKLDADDAAIEAARALRIVMSSFVRWTRATNHAWANAA